MWIAKLLQNLGGRKFLLSILAIGCGTAIEILSPRGVTPAFAAFLTSCVGAFAVSNWASSREYFKSQGQKKAEKPTNSIELEQVKKVLENQQILLEGTAETVYNISTLLNTVTQGNSRGENTR